jgi:hypothetical protein
MLFALLFILGWMFLLILILGETHAMNEPTSKFTKWWNKNVIGIEKNLDSYK